jgi:mono/diheme cytochrome c family protein
MKHANKIFIFLFLFPAAGILALAQSWQVPKEKADKVGPRKFTDEVRKKGEILFQRNCVSCHGTPGRNNFINLTLPPGDPATDKFQKQTDGALFFKITTGRSPMPSFRDVLTEEERWEVIAYIRSFNKTYIQPEPVAVLKGIYSGMKMSMEVSYVQDKHQIRINVKGSKNGLVRPMKGIELNLFAKRYFGNLEVDEPRTTDSAGNAYFEYLNLLPGDTIGKVDFIVKVNTEGLESMGKDTVVMAGKPLTAKSLVDTRSMWSVRSKAPWWLMISYISIVIGIWVVLLFIIFQISKIRKKGSQPN